MHTLSKLAETQNPEGVADFLQQFELRDELIAASAAAPYENIEDILYFGQVFLDRGGNGPHQFHAGRGETLAFLLDRIVDRQELRELEGRPHCGNAAAAGGCPGNVVQQVVQQVDRRILAIASLADLV